MCNKFKKLDIVVKASLAYVLVGFIQKGISLISGPIFTRILSQTDYGLFSAYNSWYELIGVIAMLSLSAGVYNNGLLEFEDDRDAFTFSLLILSNVSTVIVLICGLIRKDYTVEIIGLPQNLLLIMVISYFFSPALIFWTTRQRYEYKYIKPCIVTVASTVIAVGFSIVITSISAESEKLFNKVWSEKGILLIFWVTAYVYIAYKAKFKLKIEYWKYALKFNLPLIPHYLSNYILNSIDRVMILNLVDSVSAAIYSVAYSAAFLIQIFWQSVNSAILPITYESIKNNQENDIESRTLPFLAIYGGLCVFVAFIAPELMAFLAPESYHEGIYLIPIMVMGVFLTGLYCLFANVEFYYKSTKFIALNSILSATLNIILNYFFIIKFGYMAAAYTTVLSYLLQTILHYINYRRVSRRIYDEKKILFVTFAVFGGCILCIPLYTHTIVRYVILVVIVILVFVNRNKLINIYKNLKNEKS
jgi:O-antigen/teichoic acid export membrane protein